MTRGPNSGAALASAVAQVIGIDRFMQQVVARDGCLEWTGPRGPSGYGMVGGIARTRSLYAHRVSYALFVGDVPPRAVVMHRCDNPSCVNPIHLLLADQAENVRDMMRKRRNRHRPNINASTMIESVRVLGAFVGERRARLFCRYLGLFGHRPETLQMIGDDIGVSRERVRQIVNRVAEKIGPEELLAARRAA